jgi:hypothetical protein
MTRSLLVAVAHGLDLLTFMLAVVVVGLSVEGESNLLMRSAHATAGLLGVVALKSFGAVALSCIVHLRSWALLPAAGAGVVGASVNLLAISISRH